MLISAVLEKYRIRLVFAPPGGVRDYVLPEDIKEVAFNGLNHRIILNYEAEAIKTKDFIEAILRKVPIS